METIPVMVTDIPRLEARFKEEVACARNLVRLFPVGVFIIVNDHRRSGRAAESCHRSRTRPP